MVVTALLVVCECRTHGLSAFLCAGAVLVIVPVGPGTGELGPLISEAIASHSARFYILGMSALDASG